MYKQVAEAFQDTFTVQPAFHINAQALPGKIIEHSQHPQGPAIVSATMHKIVAPDMIPLPGA